MCGLLAMVGCCNDSMSIERISLEAETLASGKKTHSVWKKTRFHTLRILEIGVQSLPPN